MLERAFDAVAARIFSWAERNVQTENRLLDVLAKASAGAGE
jgi:hypothetical protein